MVILTYSTDTLYAGTVRIPAGMSVVTAWAASTGLAKAAKRAGLPAPRVSGTGHYLRHYCGQDLTGKSLCSWRGCGIGDQLMWSALLAELHRRYPSATIHHYVPPALVPLCSMQVPYTVLPDPIPFADWQTYDYHLIGENLCECDSEPDQGCHYDHLLQFAGIDPATVAPEHKRPTCRPSAADAHAAADWLQAHSIPRASSAQPLILWQLASSNLQRAYPPAQTYQALIKLTEAFPTSTILLLGRSADLKHYPQLPKLPQIVHCINEPLPMLAALMQNNASLLICPDSALGHLAAAFPHLPVISLWGPFAPNDRVRYYPNHHPLVGVSERERSQPSNPRIRASERERSQPNCSPCRAHAFMRCPHKGQTWCRVLASILPSQIRHLAIQLLHP